MDLFGSIGIIWILKLRVLTKDAKVKEAKMPKKMLRGLSVLLGVLFLFGCASSKKIEVRRYVEVKDRVDQNMGEGNAGFISGTPQPEDRSNIRKTRKVYVLEVSEVPGEEEETVIIEDNEALKEEAEEESLEAEDEDIEAIEDEDEEMDDDAETLTAPIIKTTPTYKTAPVVTSKPAATFQEYTVQKDDTLQKISKKFYDSYSKWPKIYDANKDVISDPDKIKPGIVLQIPMQ